MKTESIAFREEPDAPELELLGLIATGQARTRSDLAARTGLARATITKRLQHLIDLGLIKEEDGDISSGGRRARLLTFNTARGLAIAVDLGEDHARVAITDLNPEVLIESTGTLRLSDGPEVVLSWVNDEIARLMLALGRSEQDVAGACLALPAPVDWRNGKVVGPSVMTGWDGYDIRSKIRSVHRVPVVVDNDVNLLGLSEFRRFQNRPNNVLFVKAGTGIGSAIFAAGELYRGSYGSAGDIGHIHMPSDGEKLCRCGKTGCLEARAGGWAIARDLREASIPAETARDVAKLADAGQPEAIQLLREAGRVLGEAIAAAIGLLNPEVLVLGGVLSHSGDHLVTGVREIVYRRSLPLAVRNLQISVSSLGSQAGVLGAAQLVVDRLVRPVEQGTQFEFVNWTRQLRGVRVTH